MRGCPCFEDYTEQNVMGNIEEQSILEIWNTDQGTRISASDFEDEETLSAPGVCKDLQPAC